MTRWRAAGLAVVFGSLFVLAPGIFWFDDAEFVSAAFCLGIPHPTGFPLYDLLARGFQLLPLGSVPFRTHLLSLGATLGGLALGLRLLTRAGLEVPACLLGLGAVLALTGRTLFLHAAAAEVYGLTLLLVFGGVSLAWEALESRDARAWPALALLTGLSLGAHVLAALLNGLLLAVVFLHDPRRRARQVPLGVLLGLLGMAVLAYLPIRAAAEPFRNWGDPRTLPAFLDHVSGGRIVRSFQDRVGGFEPTRWLDSGRLLLGLVWEDLGAFLPLGVLGGLALVRSAPRRRLLGLLSLAVAADLAFSLLLNPMGIRDRQTGSVTQMALVLGAVGLASEALSRLSRQHLARWALAVAAPLLPLAVMPATLFESNFGGDWHAQALGQRLFEEAAPGAQIITTSDHLSAAALHLQGVERLRPDVTHLVAQHVVESSHLRSVLAAHPEERFPPEVRDLPARLDADPALREDLPTQVAALQALLRDREGLREVWWEPGLPLFEHDLFPQGAPLGWPAGRVGGKVEPEAFLAELREYLVRADAHLSWPTGQVLSGSLALAATVAARQGKLDLAALLLERALKFDPVNARAFNNLGAVMSRKHDLAAAERLASRAVELEPDYLSALINLARYRALLGMSTSAVETLEHARALDRTGEHARELNEVQALLRK